MKLSYTILTLLYLVEVTCKISYRSLNYYQTQLPQQLSSELNWVGGRADRLPTFDSIVSSEECHWFLSKSCYVPRRLYYRWGIPKVISELVYCNGTRECVIEETDPVSLSIKKSNGFKIDESISKIISINLNYNLSSSVSRSRIPDTVIVGPCVKFVAFKAVSLVIDFYKRGLPSRDRGRPMRLVIPLLTKAGHLAGATIRGDLCTKFGRDLIHYINPSSYESVNETVAFFCHRLGKVNLLPLESNIIYDQT